MRKFVFPLQRLLALKKQLEGQAENRLRASGGKVAKARARLAALKQQLVDVVGGTDVAVPPAASPAGPTAAGDLLGGGLAHNAFADRMEAAMVVAESELATATEAHEAEREAYQRVRMEAKALETLHDAGRTAHQRREMQAMQKELDGTLTHQWSRDKQHSTEAPKSGGYRDV